MVKLVTRILLFGTIILLLSFSALHINPNYKREYVAGMIPKLEKLKSVKEKKIVIIGGSNATFGIDTDLMERQLNIPVVNMSLHGGLPLKYIIEQVKCHLKRGDILILSKEYEGLKDQYWNTMRGIELPKVALYDLSQIYVLFSDQKLFESTITGIYRTIEHYIAKYPIEPMTEIESVYDVRSFHGDNVISEFMTGTYEEEIKEHPLHTHGKNALVSVELKKYKEYFNDKGVEFYLTPPVITEGFYNDKAIMPFWGALSEATEIPMLSNEKDYTYSKEYFFNSHYHTNYEGRRIRTESLIDDLLRKGLVSKENVRSKIIYVANKKALDQIFLGEFGDSLRHKGLNIGYKGRTSLDLFNSSLGYKILGRDSKGIAVKQDGNLGPNYFRMKISNEDLTGYNFNLFLECDSVVLHNIRFRGFGKLEEFDTIVEKGNNTYKLSKKVKDVFYNDNNSYLGISFPPIDTLVNSEFVIRAVEVYQNYTIMEEYQIREGAILNVEVISSDQNVNLTEIMEITKGTELKTNRLYRIIKKDGITLIKDFYTGNTIFVTNEDIRVKSSNKNIIGVYQ